MNNQSLEEQMREIAQELKTQDNLCTALPIYMVQTKRRITGMDPIYGDDNYVWMDTLNDYEEADEELAKILDEQEENGNISEEYSDYEKIYYLDLWENKMPFFTMKAAQEYIERNKHRLKEPRVYVESGYRNKEWEAVREYLMGQIS